MRKIWLFFCLTGCTLGPKHEIPPICLPSQYQEAIQPLEPVDLCLFWKQFEDPLLNDLVEEAVHCNYDLQIALHKIEEVRALYRIEASALYPQLQGNLFAERAKQSQNIAFNIVQEPSTLLAPSLFGGPLIQSFFQTGFDASWELDLFGKNRKNKEAAFYDFEASEESALDVQITLISDVVRFYLNIRMLQEQIENQKEQIIFQKEILSLVESKYVAGLVSYVDVSNAIVSLSEKEAILPPLEKDLKQTVHSLAILLGRLPENFCLEGDKFPDGSLAIPGNLPSELLCRRPDIRKAERELAAATARIGVAKAELFPSFPLLGSFGVQSNNLNNLFTWPSRFWSIGPNMIWNLFTGGKLISQVEVTNQRQKQAILNYEKVVHVAFQEVEDHLVGYFKEKNRLNQLKEKLHSNEVLYELTLSQYEAGLISFDRVLDIENLLFLNRQDVTQSKTVVMIEIVALYKALGGGWQCFDSL